MRSARTILSDVGPRAKSVGYRPEGEGGYTVEVKDANGLVVLRLPAKYESVAVSLARLFARNHGLRMVL